MGRIVLLDGRDVVLGRDVENFDDESEISVLVDLLRDHNIADPAAAIRGKVTAAAQALDEIPGYGPPKPHAHDGVGRWMIDQLTDSGRWLISKAERIPYYFNGVTKEPVDCRSDEMANVVTKKFGHYPDEPPVKHALVMIAHHPEVAGEEVDLRRSSWYDAKKNELWIDQGEGKILRVVDGAEPETLQNGFGGVMFEKQALGSPWEYRKDHRSLIDEGWISHLSFVDGDPFTREEQSLLFKLWLMSFWFRSTMPARPIVMGYGEKGSGKTTAFELVGRLLIGDRFVTNPPPDKDGKRDFETMVVNRRYMVIDNLDNYVRWLEDVIAAIATGSGISARVLFENMKEGVYVPDVFMAITTREPKHRRDDIADRSLFFLFEPFGENQTRNLTDLRGWMSENRSELLSEMVDFAREILAVPRERGAANSFRMSDFASFVIRSATALDNMVEEGRATPPARTSKWVDVAKSVLIKQSGYQSQFASEDDPVLSVLPLWIYNYRGNETGMNKDLEHRTTDLFTEWRRIAEENGIAWFIRSANALNNHLKSRRSLIETEYKLTGPIRRGGGPRSTGGTFWRIQPKDEADDTASDSDVETLDF